MSNTLNPAEAPRGFYAVLKPKWNSSIGNLCRLCDARPLCQENKNDFCRKNKCSDYETVCSKTGIILKRLDGCDVFFKKNIQGELF